MATDRREGWLRALLPGATVIVRWPLVPDAISTVIRTTPSRRIALEGGMEFNHLGGRIGGGAARLANPTPEALAAIRDREEAQRLRLRLSTALPSLPLATLRQMGGAVAMTSPPPSRAAFVRLYRRTRGDPCLLCGTRPAEGFGIYEPSWRWKGPLPADESGRPLFPYRLCIACRDSYPTDRALFDAVEQALEVWNQPVKGNA